LGVLVAPRELVVAAFDRAWECNMRFWPKALPKKLRFHDLRHSTATLLLKAGVPLATVQRILRHTDPRITAGTYGHLDLDDLRAGLAKLTLGPAAPRPPEPRRSAPSAPPPAHADEAQPPS
jgi:hypothetical protein